MQTKLFKLSMAGLILVMLGVGLGAVGEANSLPQMIIQPPPHPRLDVDIRTDRSWYSIGSELRIFGWVSERAYLYVLNYDTQGQTRLVFPNRYSQNNLIGPGSYQLPDKPYRFRVTGPPGTEYLLAIASTTKINVYNFLRFPQDPFKENPYPLIPDPQALREEVRSKLKAEFRLQIGGEKPGIQFRIEPVEWDTAWTSFQVGAGPVNQNPEAQFNYWPSNPQVNQVIHFDASASSDPDGYITSWQWDFDSNGVTDAWGQTTTHQFYYQGEFKVTLTVQDDDGATSSTTRIVTVSQVGIGARFSVTEPVSFQTNGDWISGWYWIREWNHWAKWSWNRISLTPNQAYINFHLLVTNKVNGGSGFSATVKIKILNQWGQVVEQGQVNLINSFKPQFTGNTQGVGCSAYGAYQIQNLSLLRQRFTVKIEWPPVGSRYRLATQQDSASLAYTY